MGILAPLETHTLSVRFDMKTKWKWLIAASLAALVGCASPPPAGVDAIHGGMTVDEVGSLLGVTGTMGRWSGDTGYFVYRLSTGTKVSVGCILSKDGRYCVHSNLTVFVQDGERGQKKWIRKPNQAAQPIAASAAQADR